MADPWHRHPNRGFETRQAVWVFVGLAAAALVLTWWRGPSEIRINGTSCSRLTVAEQLAAADLVLEGTVFIVIPSRNGAEVIISPERVYRGKLPERGIRIVAQRGQTPMGAPAASQEGEIHFSSNQMAYLLFLHERADGRYNTRACFGTRLLGTGLTAEERAVLGPGEAAVEP